MNKNTGLGPISIVIALAVILGGGYMLMSQKSKVEPARTTEAVVQSGGSVKEEIGNDAIADQVSGDTTVPAPVPEEVSVSSENKADASIQESVAVVTEPVKTKQADSTKKAPIDTTNWKTYKTNSGFSFSYPPQFTPLPLGERIVASLTSPSCDFVISLDSHDAASASRATENEDWYVSAVDQTVTIGANPHTATLVYDGQARLRLVRVDGYFPGMMMVMGTPKESGLSETCVRELYAMFKTFIP